MTSPFRILYQDEYIIAIDKPWGFHVHAPEDQSIRVPHHKICLPILRAHLKRYVYPVHRIDVATTGILLWALTPEAAKTIGQQFQSHTVKKTYHAIVRGHTPDSFDVDIKLKSDSLGLEQEAHTHFKKLSQIEFAKPVGKKFSSARYTWLEVTPQTGRYHQIRRHCNRISHPIIGDTDHGDSHHNRFFREDLGLRGLCLRAIALELQHPTNKGPIRIEAKPNSFWRKVEKLFLQHDQSEKSVPL